MTPSSKQEPVFSPRRLRVSGAVLSAQTALSRLIETEAVEPTGYDPTVTDLLIRLDQAPEHRLRAVDLSRQLLMSPSHISRTIDRAASDGLVERSPDPNDRRASQVCLTSEGRDAVVEFAPLFTAVIERVIDKTLTTEESDTLVELLGRIEAAACQPCPEESD